MKKLFSFLMTILVLLTACGGGSSDANSVAVDADVAGVAAEEAPTELPATPTTMPTPTNAPQPTQSLAKITSPEAMVGIWLGTVAGESGYVMYTADGRFLVALSQDALVTAPLVSGEYWFEDGQIHLRDLENAGHWAECDPQTVGVYDVVDLGDGQVAFQLVDDQCGESGFTRGYLFSNMKQEWIAEPDEVDQPESAAETLPSW